MSMKELKRWSEKVRRVKFFAKKHDELEKFRDGLACSIWMDTQDPEDAEFLKAVNKVCMHLENKLLEV